MSAVTETIEQVKSVENYKYGFVTDIESESAPKGLSEDIVRFISAKKRSLTGFWNGGSRHIATGSPWGNQNGRRSVIRQ